MSQSPIKLRHIANLILPWLMWAASTVPIVFDVGRGPQALSEASNTLLVPFGPAFSIWFPIFIGCIIYGIMQFLPRSRDRAIFQDIRLYTATSFFCVMMWGLISAFVPIAPARWMTALVFVPGVVSICCAVIIASSRKVEFKRWELWAIYTPLCWLAGWCSIAVFLNWAQLGVHDAIGFGLNEVSVCLLTLAAALGWAVIMLKRTNGSYAYLFPIVWGLGFLVLNRTAFGTPNMTIAYSAGIGAVVLIGSALILNMQNKKA